MTLYEINQNIMSLIDEETGEITDIAAFEALLGAKDAKIENIIKLYKNATADSTALKAEADAFTKRAKAAAALADRMKAMLEALREKWKRHDELAQKMSEIIKKYGLSSPHIAEQLKRSKGVERY